MRRSVGGLGCDIGAGVGVGVGFGGFLGAAVADSPTASTSTSVAMTTEATRADSLQDIDTLPDAVARLGYGYARPRGPDEGYFPRPPSKQLAPFSRDLPPAAEASPALDGARRAGPRDNEAAAVGAERRGKRDRLPGAVDHRDGRRAQRAETHVHAIAHRAARDEAHRAEVAERNDAAARARRLLHPLRGRAR